MFSIDGKLHRKLEEQQKSEKFRSREFVLEIAAGNYPQYIKFQLVQERCSLIDSFSEGDLMKVHFDLTGREYNSPKGETIYFTNLSAWKVEGGNGATSSAPSRPAAKQNPPSDNSPFPTDEPAGGFNDDLPF
jgi:hypothetical protein